MSKQPLSKYEKEIKEVVNKKDSELTESDRQIKKIISQAVNYFSIYDETENKNTLTVFRALFLETKNRSKSELAFASEFGLSRRSIIRHKKKVLKIYACIYDHSQM